MIEDDPIIDRSPEQKKLRIERLTGELHGLGFSVVKTEWLRALVMKNARQTGKYEVIA